MVPNVTLGLDTYNGRYRQHDDAVSRFRVAVIAYAASTAWCARLGAPHRRLTRTPAGRGTVTSEAKGRSLRLGGGPYGPLG